MYRAVELEEADRDLHRFLWRATKDGPIKDYRMTRVTFGVASSPFLAVQALQNTAQDFGDQFPLAKDHVLNPFYVDDLLAGADSPEDALQLQRQLRQLLFKGGFNLRKWRSSSPQVMQQIDPTLHEKVPTKDLLDDHSTQHPKALGTVWDSHSDCMYVSIGPSTEVIPTKRGVISDIARTFDVLGWLAPTLICMKILFQRLWEFVLHGMTRFHLTCNFNTGSGNSNSNCSEQRPSTDVTSARTPPCSQHNYTDSLMRQRAPTLQWFTSEPPTQRVHQQCPWSRLRPR